MPAESQMTRPIWATKSTIRMIGFSVMSVSSASLLPIAPAQAAVTRSPPNIQPNTRWKPCGAATSACWLRTPYEA